MRYGTPSRWARFLGERGASALEGGQLCRVKAQVLSNTNSTTSFTQLPPVSGDTGAGTVTATMQAAETGARLRLGLGLRRAGFRPLSRGRRRGQRRRQVGAPVEPTSECLLAFSVCELGGMSTTGATMVTLTQ
ncbi:hypothetical protein GCM10023081_09360 [Arthrobacter ginkgonis]|uniref:Uncharacterized protein n=1 Tax=Arthrobacter ginkgonis TaxID=1630594 RepID=A0ABP7C0E9_9MICC